MAVNASLLLLRRSRGSFFPLRRSLAAVSVAGASFSSPSSSLTLAKKQLSSASSILPWNPIHLSLHQSFRRFSSAAFSSSAAAEVAEQPAPSMQERFKFAYQDHKPRELGIDEIEGCDFNHWLIVVDFPKDRRPSHEEMVRFYEETCAKSLNISLEEAKKKIYACSTSNYTGFHVEVTEVESEKFNGQPGVIFVLPDSYVDKEKKEYGGDKYINGVIIPRPRSGKRIREDFKPDRQRRSIPARQESPVSSQERPSQLVKSSDNHEAPTQGRPVSYQQRNTPHDTNNSASQSNQVQYKNGFQGQTEIRDPRSYQFQQNYSPPLQGENVHQPSRSFQHSYNLPLQGERRDTTPMRSSYQENYDKTGVENFHHHELRESPQGYNRTNYAPPRFQGGFREDCQNYRSGDRVAEAYYHGVNTESVQQGNQGFIQRQGQGAPEPYWGYRESIQSQPFSQDQRNLQGSGFEPVRSQQFSHDQRNFQGQGFEPIRSQPFSQDQRNLQGPGFEPIRSQQQFLQDQRNFQGPGFEPMRSQPFSQDQRNLQGPGFEPIRSQPFSQDQRNLQGLGCEPIRSQQFSQDQRNFQGPGFEPIRSQPFSQDQRNLQGPDYREPTQSQPFSQDQRNFQGPGFEPIRSQPFSQDQRNFQGPGYNGSINNQSLPQDRRNLHGLGNHEPVQSQLFSQDQRNLQGAGYREQIQSPPFSQDQRNFQGPGFEPTQSQPFSQNQRNLQGSGYREPIQSSQDQRNIQEPRYREPTQSQPFSHDQRNYQGPGFEAVQSQTLSQDQRNFQRPGFEPIQSQPFSQDPRSFQRPGFEPIQSQPFSQDQRNFQGPGFNPQEHRESPQGYRRNYAPPVAYQAGFGGEYGYYGPKPVDPFRQGPNEFPYGAPPKYEASLRHDHQSYGPPHATVYQHEDNGYQGQGPPTPYWRRSNF